GKTLEECTAAELLQMVMVRHVDRAVHESRLSDGFISDGSSLQEWIYGTVRVTVGINPNDSVHLADLESVTKTAEIAFFEEVIGQLGAAMKRHVRDTFDVFVHLPNELPLTADGHRPVNERFRSMSDEMLLKTLTELEIPYHVIGGDIASRLTVITQTLGLPAVRSVSEAIELAEQEYAAIDTTIETLRTRSAETRSAQVGSSA
ncbi:hypothetical protein ACWKSP_40730, partial [Micromonosporaceae bacterium Da 78-11]